MVGNSREALPEGKEWSGVPNKGLGVFERPFWRVGSGWEAFLEVEE